MNAPKFQTTSLLLAALTLLGGCAHEEVQINRRILTPVVVPDEAQDDQFAVVAPVKDFDESMWPGGWTEVYGWYHPLPLDAGESPDKKHGESPPVPERTWVEHSMQIPALAGGDSWVVEPKILRDYDKTFVGPDTDQCKKGRCNGHVHLQLYENPSTPIRFFSQEGKNTNVSITWVKRESSSSSKSKTTPDVAGTGAFGTG